MKVKQTEMITGFYVQPVRNEHYIYIRRINDNGILYYAKCLCHNSDFYSRMMKAELKI